MPGGWFVYTSNVDGQFQRAGFDPERIVEVHGAIDWMQCTGRCGIGIFPADPHTVTLDEATMRAVDPLPVCPSCGCLARPNILKFGDWEWDSTRTDDQRSRLKAWLESIRGRRLAVVERGAGTAILTVRLVCEDLTRDFGGTLIRINPREPDVPSGQVSLPQGSLRALRAIDGWFEPEAEGIGDAAGPP
jgi:NAD-dependent SIR2 family protein deacetylase